MRRRWNFRRSPDGRQPALAAAVEAAAGEPGVEASPVEIAPNDPLVAYFQGATGPVDLDSLDLDSPAVADLRAAGARMVVPLVSQGELIEIGRAHV